MRIICLQIDLKRGTAHFLLVTMSFNVFRIVSAANYFKLLIITFVFSIIALLNLHQISIRCQRTIPSSVCDRDHTRYANEQFIDFAFLDAKHSRLNEHLNETGFILPIVPNIVHYVILDNFTLSFSLYVSIKSVIRNHAPDAIFIHCNSDDLQLNGPYWELLMTHYSHLIGVKFIAKATQIFGQELYSKFAIYHASDIARIQVMMQFGGIYLDQDVIVIKSLEKFRHFEMTIGYPKNLGIQFFFH